MRRVGIWLGIPLILITSAPFALQAAEETNRPSASPDFQEVYDLVREHLAGMTPAELNRTAVQALISALSPAVSLVEPNQPKPIETSGGSPVSKSNLFEGPIAYIRIARVEEGLADAVRNAYQHVGTNRLNGVVLDLRLCRGEDYAAAAATADLFLKKEKPLLDYGKGMLRSKEKTDALSGPVVILVNHATARAAEALAAALRDSAAAMVIGSRTAGEAVLAQEFPLKDGTRLRIATAPIKVGESTSLTHQGLKPDILVQTKPQDEMAYLSDPFRELGGTNAAGSTVSLNATAAGTNRTRRARFNEAELVRERREGVPAPESELSGPGGESERPVVRDPSLARALDLLKGLAVIRQTKS